MVSDKVMLSFRAYREHAIEIERRCIEEGTNISEYMRTLLENAFHKRSDEDIIKTNIRLKTDLEQVKAVVKNLQMRKKQTIEPLERELLERAKEGLREYYSNGLKGDRTELQVLTARYELVKAIVSLDEWKLIAASVKDEVNQGK